MIVRLARDEDFGGFLHLAGQVEQWFGPMVEEPGFHRALREHIGQAAALVAVSVSGTGSGEEQLLGGLLFGAAAPAYHVHWLVVAQQARGTGAGRGLMAEAERRFVTGPGTLEVITFGADHPGAVESGARVFYERLGFTPAEAAEPGPEGGSRQVYRKAIA
ncbi:GNAT family N-acetyltransferase [Streptomyces indicus]|uniref:Acetyltransferase (GNAT) domain-containing protein n=1 Tax=Streptomyces indicus TaxID=417292 RepID=A0A1G8TR20_9ACTN|nr:GNAT family N-acetyltransferase [Streptomyces indicus]SDJ43992.1 Acetyltransferase (GNAT) domain-containing protein [Streptomyces indicus]